MFCTSQLLHRDAHCSYVGTNIFFFGASVFVLTEIFHSTPSLRLVRGVRRAWGRRTPRPEVDEVLLLLHMFGRCTARLSPHLPRACAGRIFANATKLTATLSHARLPCQSLPLLHPPRQRYSITQHQPLNGNPGDALRRSADEASRIQRD